MNKRKEFELILDHTKLSPEMEKIRLELDRYVIWQDEAKNQVIDALSRTLIPNPNRKRPIANLLFLWPTWVGKTEVARALSNIMFWQEDWDLRETKIDCNNFQQAHDIAELIGSPTWYIWYWDEPRLADTNVFKKFYESKKIWKLHPLIKDFDNFSILLFDEIEKADPALFKLLLWIFDEWVIALKSGKEANWWSDSKWKKEANHSKYTDFKNVIIIMTSNLWAEEIQNKFEWKSNSVWFSIPSDDNKNISLEFYKDKIKDFFAPEFIWRITEFIPFKSLTKDQLKERLNLEIIRHRKYIKDILDFKLSEQVKDLLVLNSYNSNLWGRKLISQFENDIVTIISKIIWNWEISKAENKNNKTISYIEIDLWNSDNFVVKAKFDKNKSDERFSRKVKRWITKLASDEIIVSLKENSLLYTLKDEIIPNLEYLKILYTLKEEFISNYQIEIEETEKKLLSWWLTRKDLVLVSNEIYRDKYYEIRNLFSSLDWVQIWEWNETHEDLANKKLIKKVTEKYIEDNIFLVNWWAGKIEEIIHELRKILEKYFNRLLKKEEEDFIIIIIHRIYLKNNKTTYTWKEIGSKKLDKPKESELPVKIESTKSEVLKPTPINPVVININLNIWETELNSEEEIMQIFEKTLNLFQNNIWLVTNSIKKNIARNDDLVSILVSIEEDLEKELWKLSLEQRTVLNNLIQKYLQNRKK